MKRRVFLATTGLSPALALTATPSVWAENAKLKIGFVGVTSGPAAAWMRMLASPIRPPVGYLPGS